MLTVHEALKSHDQFSSIAKVHHKMEAHVLKTTLLLVFSITTKVFGDGETDYRLIFFNRNCKIIFLMVP